MAHRHATLTNDAMLKLRRLGKSIVSSLSCNATSTGPCATDRLAAVQSMEKYLSLHGYKVDPPTSARTARSRSRAAT